MSARLGPPNVLTLPGLFGARIPSYDRSDGVSLRWGPQFVIPSVGIGIDALLTYRTHLGHVDPSALAAFEMAPRWALRATASRTTLGTNEWSVPDLVNSTATLVDGTDGQNYFRADRFDATLEWHDPGTNGALRGGIYAGLRDEFAHSVGPDTSGGPAVWSLFDQSDRGGIRRINPPVARGRILSVLGGASGTWVSPHGVSLKGSLDVEVPTSAPGGARFVQLTGEETAALPAFADHRLTVFARALVTVGDSAPPQRYSYVGGPYTLPTLAMLAQGGDEMVYVESLYEVPLRFIQIPLVGPPSVGALYLLGGGGVHGLPRLTQNVGIRVQALAIRIDLVIDPVNGHADVSWGGVLPRP